jgi:hypothetical protein
MDEPAEAGGLSEETHLFAKFTSTYMIQDFLHVEENGGVEEAFPRNVQCEAAMVFSDLSGFSKLCESYVEKFSHMDSAGAAMSQAAEKLNVVVNRCWFPETAPPLTILACNVMRHGRDPQKSSSPPPSQPLTDSFAV